MCIGQVKGGIYGVPFGLTKVFKSPGGGYLLFSFVLVPFTLFGLVDMCRYPCIVFVFVERSLLCWFLCFWVCAPSILVRHFWPGFIIVPVFLGRF